MDADEPRTAPPAPAAPVALVAGASRGLGLLLAQELLGRGYAVAICARGEEALAEAERRLSGFGTVRAYPCDVSDREAVQRLVDAVEGDLGEVEVLLSVAGVIQVGPLASLTLDHVDEAIGTMLYGPVHLAWAVLPAMRRRGAGRIGTVTSIGGKAPAPHLLPYVTAKYGAVGFSEALAVELSGTGVTATTVVPGLMRTGSHERAMFTGDHGAEYAWFAPGASLPVLSIGAERAARRIVDGVLAGRPLVTFTPLARIGMRVHGLMPATAVRVLGLVARALPDPPRDPQTATLEGWQAAGRLSAGPARAVRALTVLGTRAARRHNERVGRTAVR